MQLRRADVIAAALLVVFAFGDVLWSPDWRGSVGVNVVVVPAVAATVVLRRRAPLVPLSAVTLMLAGLGVAYGSSQSWTNVVLVAVVVYAAAAYTERLVPVLALAGVSAIVHAGLDPSISGFGDAIWGSSFTGLVLLAGLTGRHLHRRSLLLEARSARLDANEEELMAAAAAEERRRIAWELHDIISHNLGILVLQAGAAEQALGRDENQVRSMLRSMRSTGQQAIGEMTTLLEVLHEQPDTSRSPQPTLADIPALVGAARSAGVEVTNRVDGDLDALPAAVELSAYRVVQEALTNAVKHAPGSCVHVSVRGGREELTIDVTNGPGTGSHDRPPSGQRGLAGLRERVSVFGGAFDAAPTRDGGWRVRATFPVLR